MVRLLVQKGPVVKGAIKSSTTRSSVRSSWIVSEQDTVNRDSETISPGLNYKFVNPYWDSPVRIIFKLHSNQNLLMFLHITFTSTHESFSVFQTGDLESNDPS